MRVMTCQSNQFLDSLFVPRWDGTTNIFQWPWDHMGIQSRLYMDRLNSGTWGHTHLFFHLCFDINAKHIKDDELKAPLFASISKL